MAVVLALAGSVALAAPTNWSNADWSYRAQISAFSPDAKENALVEWDVDFADLLARAGATGTFDPNSPRVMMIQAGQEKEVPSRFFPDKDTPAAGRLSWLRLGTMGAGSSDTYSIYFDQGTSKPAKSYPELAHAKPVLGKNMLVNGTLTVADKADPSKAASWIYDAAQAAGTLELLRKIDPAGITVMKFTNTKGGESTVKATQITPVEAGKRYALCCWYKAEKESAGAVVMTGWLYTADNKVVTGPDGAYSNYKLQVGRAAKGESPWRYMCGANIWVFDPKTKTNHEVDEDKTLPGTGLIGVDVDYCGGTGAASFTGFELREMPTGLPIGIWVTSIEKKP